MVLVVVVFALFSDVESTATPGLDIDLENYLVDCFAVCETILAGLIASSDSFALLMSTCDALLPCTVWMNVRILVSLMLVESAMVSYCAFLVVLFGMLRLSIIINNIQTGN